MAKEVKAPQLLGRSDKQGQFRLAPQPKYCSLPFLLYLLPVPSPSSTTETTVLDCTARTLLRDFSLLAVKKEHSCFGWPLFTLSVCVSPFLLLYHCRNTFAHTQQPLLGAAVALGRVLPYWKNKICPWEILRLQNLAMTWNTKDTDEIKVKEGKKFWWGQIYFEEF